MKSWLEIDATIAALRLSMQIGALNPYDRSVYDALVRAANVGDRCPTDPVLAELAGFSSPDSANRTVRRLEALGLISVVTGGCHRQVAITVSRKTTAPVVRSPRYHGGGRDQRLTAPPPAPAMHRVIDRTPCPRCGVRGDLGCVHRAASEPQLVAA